MKERELREHAVCEICGKPIGHSNNLHFWTLNLTQHKVDIEALKRQDGLTALLGGHAGLAAIMGPDEEMTEALGTKDITICLQCVTPLIGVIISAVESHA